MQMVASCSGVALGSHQTMALLKWWHCCLKVLRGGYHRQNINPMSPTVHHSHNTFTSCLENVIFRVTVICKLEKDQSQTIMKSAFCLNGLNAEAKTCWLYHFKWETVFVLTNYSRIFKFFGHTWHVLSSKIVLLQQNICLKHTYLKNSTHIFTPE